MGEIIRAFLRTKFCFKVSEKLQSRFLIGLFSAIFFFIAPKSSYAQVLAINDMIKQRPLQDNENKESLKKILLELEVKYKINFHYNDDLIDNIYVRRQILGHLPKELDGSLSALLSPFKLRFKKISNQVYVIQPESVEKGTKSSESKSELGGETGLTPKDSADNSLKKDFFYNHSLHRAEFKINGRVNLESGEGIPGVNILLKGTYVGTTTDINGSYAISVPEENGTLVFSYVGYTTMEIPINNRSVIDVALSPDVIGLQEVVVTALGIEKNAKELTYATQQISGEELVRAKDPNFINALAGKSAGVVITRGTSGVGGSSKIVLRGNKSIQGNNQPLFVIDGIPMNNATGAQPGTLYGAFDGGDALSNLNPEDIENINVLKGASAAALYGSQAANGVILITTKKGKKGISKIDFTSTTTFEDPLILPKIQNKYGQDDPGKSPDSWGDEISNGSNSHIKNFYNTGTNFINTISLTNGNDNGQFYFSYANTRAHGIVPQNELNKHNLNLRGMTRLLNDKLSIDGGINFIKQDIKNRPSGGYYLNPVLGLYLFPTGDDFNQYKNAFEVKDPVRNLNVQNWPYFVNDGSSSQNPYWVLNRNTNSLARNRSIYTLNAKYSFTDWLNVQGRMNYDRVEDNFEQNLYASTDVIFSSENGEYTKQATLTSQLYSDLLLNFNKNLSKDISLSATLGFSNTENQISDNRISSYTNTAGDIIKSGLYYANVFSLANLRGNFSKSESLNNRLTQALFASANWGYKNTLFWDVTGRNEWSSTVSSAFFYPSVGLAYILTETTGSSDILSFAKLRSSYSEVGNGLPFGVSNGNAPSTINTDGSIILPTILPKYELKPERTKSFELGAEAKLFNGRLNLSFTYYTATSYDQLFPILARSGDSTFTGRTSQYFYINGGKIRNSGIESSIGYNAKFGYFEWHPSFNISTNKNTVLELSKDLDNPFVVLSTFSQTKIYELRVQEGGSYGEMYGRVLKKDAAGNVEKDPATGNPIVEDGQYLGNTNPKFLTGFNNNFRYKNASLSFLIDGRFGGKVISTTQAFLDGRGLSERSAEAREGSFKVGNTEFDPEKYYKTIGGSNPVGGEYVYSASNIRLRELSIGYTIPKIGNALKNLTFSLVGRNLFFFKNHAPFDPETVIGSGNGLSGLDAFNLPSTRSFGFNLKVSF